MSTDLQRDVRFLKSYAVISTLAFGALVLAAFTRQREPTTFEAITVERINVVEPDGSYRTILSNRPGSTGPIYKASHSGMWVAVGQGSSSSTTRAPRTAASRSPDDADRMASTPRPRTCPLISSIRTKC